MDRCKRIPGGGKQRCLPVGVHVCVCAVKWSDSGPAPKMSSSRSLTSNRMYVFKPCPKDVFKAKQADVKGLQEQNLWFQDLQFVTLDTHFVRKGCISWCLVCTAPGLRKKDNIEEKRRRGRRERRRETETERERGRRERIIRRMLRSRGIMPRRLARRCWLQHIACHP